MKWESGDLRVGIAVLAALLLLVTAILWLTPTLGDRRQPLYTEFSRIDGIAEQAPVQLNGFTIGRVDDIQPKLSERDGSLVFRVRMKINWKLGSGEALPIPVGTRARLTPPLMAVGNNLLVGYIVLEPPARGGGPPLQPGETIPGVRSEAAIDQVQALATGLASDVTVTLVAARTLMDSLGRATSMAQRMAAKTNTELPALFDNLQRDLAIMDSAMRELRTLTPAAIGGIDSAKVMLSDTRRLVGDMSRMVQQREPQFERVLSNLDTATALLNHFVREVSRRPARVVTGVEAPPGLDPVRERERRAKTCPRGSACAAREDSLAGRTPSAPEKN